MTNNDHRSGVGEFVVGLVVGLFLMMVVASLLGKQNRWYIHGVQDTHKEAWAEGLMVKEIDDETDKVIYRWIETHKLGYEEAN